MLADDPRFARFWAAYPRKEHKAEARQVFATMFKGGLFNDALLDLLIVDCKRRYRDTERKYIPCADRYLRRRRWEDEELPQAGSATAPEPRRVPVRVEMSEDERALGLAVLRAARRRLGA